MNTQTHFNYVLSALDHFDLGTIVCPVIIGQKGRDLTTQRKHLFHERGVDSQAIFVCLKGTLPGRWILREFELDACIVRYEKG